MTNVKLQIKIAAKFQKILGRTPTQRLYALLKNYAITNL